MCYDQMRRRLDPYVANSNNAWQEEHLAGVDLLMQAGD